jgi:hypothetical protein
MKDAALVKKIQSAITDEIFYALGLRFIGRDVPLFRRISAGQFFFGGLFPCQTLLTMLRLTIVMVKTQSPCR